MSKSFFSLLTTCVLSISVLDASGVPSSVLKGKINQLMPTVVDVVVTSKDKNFDSSQEMRGQKNEISDGAGFIIEPSGYIVTNCHVIDSTDKIKIILYDGSEYYANVIGKDEHSDIALLKIATETKLLCVQFADSDKVEVGDPVIAIGNPFGFGKTVTSGIISYKSRNLANQMAEIGSCGDLVSYIQTDAAVNHGNSGGPLFTYTGEVVGMITVFFSDGMHNTGINFAIPSNILKKVINQLMAYGKMRRSWLGISLVPLSHKVAVALGLGKRHGCDIVRVEKNSPAAIAGVQNNDILLSLNDEDITEETNIGYMLNNLPIDKVIPIQIMRDGIEIKLSVKVGSKNDENIDEPEQNAEENAIEIPSQKIEILKLAVADLSADLRKNFYIPAEMNGVLVIENENSAENDIAYGDLITKINQHDIKNIEDFKNILKTLKERNVVALYIYNPQKSPKRFYIAVDLTSDAKKTKSKK